MSPKTKHSSNGKLTHGEVVHELKRRIRVVSPVLRKDIERAYILEILLQKRDGIAKVRTVADIASVVIPLRPGKAAESPVVHTIGYDAGQSRKEKPSAVKEMLAKSADDSNAAVDQKYSLAIDGMTCVSCALLIEMLLRRDPRIVSATINYATETASITGHLSKDSLCALIDRMGYRAQSFDTLTQRKLLVEREKKRLDDARPAADRIGRSAKPARDGDRHDGARVEILALDPTPPRHADCALGRPALFQKSLQPCSPARDQHGQPDCVGRRFVIRL